MTSPYHQAVAANLAHLGTSLTDWQALAHLVVSGSPVVDWSAAEALTQAPSLYFDDGHRCELCGHPIMHQYGVICESKGWKMTVGSECVGRFTGVTGAQAATAAVKADAEVTAKVALAAMRSWNSLAFANSCDELVDARKRIKSILKKAAKAEKEGRLSLWVKHYTAEIGKVSPAGEWLVQVLDIQAAKDAYWTSHPAEREARDREYADCAARAAAREAKWDAEAKSEWLQRVGNAARWDEHYRVCGRGPVTEAGKAAGEAAAAAAVAQAEANYPAILAAADARVAAFKF